MLIAINKPPCSVGRAKGSVVESVSGHCHLVPDHSSVVRSYISVKSIIIISLNNSENIKRAALCFMPCFFKAFFTSDFNRNKRIYKDKIAQLHLAKDSSIEELVNSIIKELKHTRNIKHCFDYKFKTSTNVELYRIVFATPHIKGLEKIKEVLWKVFAWGTEPIRLFI